MYELWTSSPLEFLDPKDEKHVYYPVAPKQQKHIDDPRKRYQNNMF